MEELAGVLSHELAHIKSNDTLTLTISATIVGAVVALFVPLLFIGRIIGCGKCISVVVVATTALLAAVLLQLMLSRLREYAADKGGAIICGHPDGLTSALSKLAKVSKQSHNNLAIQNLASGALYFVGSGSNPSWVKLFSTDPPIESRIAQLRQMTTRG